MHKDREKWNKKYQEGTQFGPPSPLVTSFYKLSPGQKVLDIAAGTGRNAFYLAQRGFYVVAADIADKALQELKEIEHPNIFPVQADMDNFPLLPNSFHLILNFRFLDRRMFPYIRESLTPGGILLFESALESNREDISQPSNRDHLLRPNELLHSFLSLRIISYQEKVLWDYLFPDKAVSLASLVAGKETVGIFETSEKI